MRRAVGRERHVKRGRNSRSGRSQRQPGQRHGLHAARIEFQRRAGCRAERRDIRDAAGEREAQRARLNHRRPVVRLLAAQNQASRAGFGQTAVGAGQRRVVCQHLRDRVGVDLRQVEHGAARLDCRGRERLQHTDLCRAVGAAVEMDHAGEPAAALLDVLDLEHAAVKVDRGGAVCAEAEQQLAGADQLAAAGKRQRHVAAEIGAPHARVVLRQMVQPAAADRDGGVRAGLLGPEAHPAHGEQPARQLEARRRLMAFGFKRTAEHERADRHLAAAHAQGRGAGRRRGIRRAVAASDDQLAGDLGAAADHFQRAGGFGIRLGGAVEADHDKPVEQVGLSLSADHHFAVRHVETAKAGRRTLAVRSDVQHIVTGTRAGAGIEHIQARRHEGGCSRAGLDQCAGKRLRLAGEGDVALGPQHRRARVVAGVERVTARCSRAADIVQGARSQNQPAADRELVEAQRAAFDLCRSRVERVGVGQHQEARAVLDERPLPGDRGVHHHRLVVAGRDPAAARAERDRQRQRRAVRDGQHAAGRQVERTDAQAGRVRHCERAGACDRQRHTAADATVERDRRAGRRLNQRVAGQYERRRQRVRAALGREHGRCAAAVGERQGRALYRIGCGVIEGQCAERRRRGTRHRGGRADRIVKAGCRPRRVGRRHVPVAGRFPCAGGRKRPD